MLLEGNVEYNNDLSSDQRDNPNILNRILKNYTNANARGFFRALNPFDRKPSYLSEKDFTPEQLNVLRQAIVNREYNIKNNYIDPKQKGRLRSISYEDYEPSYFTNKPIFAPGIKSLDTIIRFQNSKDPVWDMQTTIGSGDYMVYPNGKVTLQDIYDVNKDTRVDNPLFNVAHEVVKLFGNPYDIRIDLGNINDWNMSPNYERGY